MAQAERAVWFPSAAWPLHKEGTFPYSTEGENGMTMIVDLAHDDDDLCDETVVMLHGLDRERQTSVCILPRGHDTPHMPQDEGTVANVGRLIVRSIGRAEDDAAANPWAEGVAGEVRSLLAQTPQKWLDPRDFAHVYRYSDDQAGHILRRAFEYGALERTKEGRRFVYRPAVAGPGHVVDVPVAASEPTRDPKAGCGT